MLVFSNLHACDVLELTVLVLQFAGVVGLCVWRFMPSTRWADRGRALMILALLGLGVTGAALGNHDSEFALFAGGSITALLIGMTLGSDKTHNDADESLGNWSVEAA